MRYGKTESGDYYEKTESGDYTVNRKVIDGIKPFFEKYVEAFDLLCQNRHIDKDFVQKDCLQYILRNLKESDKSIRQQLTFSHDLLEEMCGDPTSLDWDRADWDREGVREMTFELLWASFCAKVLSKFGAKLPYTDQPSESRSEMLGIIYRMVLLETDNRPPLTIGSEICQ